MSNEVEYSFRLFKAFQEVNVSLFACFLGLIRSLLDLDVFPLFV